MNNFTSSHTTSTSKTLVQRGRCQLYIMRTPPLTAWCNKTFSDLKFKWTTNRKIEIFSQIQNKFTEDQKENNLCYSSEKVKSKFGELVSNSKIYHAMKKAFLEKLKTPKSALKLKLAKCCIEICSHTTVMFKPVHREDKSTYGSCKC